MITAPASAIVTATIFRRVIGSFKKNDASITMNTVLVSFRSDTTAACEYLKPASQLTNDRYEPKNVPQNIHFHAACGRNPAKTDWRSGWSASNGTRTATPPAIRIVLTSISG